MYGLVNLLGGSSPITIPKDMGMVWEAYHKGVPLLGVPGITLDTWRIIPGLGYVVRITPLGDLEGVDHHGYESLTGNPVLAKSLFFGRDGEVPSLIMARKSIASYIVGPYWI